MGFDVENFGIGLAAGWGSAYAVYRFRRQIRNALTATQQQATNAQNYATRSADARYINDLIALAQHSHMAGRFINLTDILIEPRFLPPARLAAPLQAEETVHSVFHVVPTIHDHSWLHGNYNLETLSIHDLAAGPRALALLAPPGSGRTTALLSIALHSLGQIQHRIQNDVVQARLDEEEAALNDKQRAQRIQERTQREERAILQLREQHGIQWDAETAAETIGFRRYVPVYVHLGNVTLNPEEFGPQIDPTEPLVRAVQSQVGPITARSLPTRLYRWLTQGQALLLLDGLDDLPQHEQQEKLIWLRALLEHYNENFFIVAGTPYGSGTLINAGLTPVYLHPWDDLRQTALIQTWAQHWPTIEGTRRKPAPRPTEAFIKRATVNNRALSPLDQTLKIWTTLADDADAAGYSGWVRRYLRRHLPDNQILDDILPQLALIAAVQLDDGFITLQRLESIGSLDSIDTTADDSEDTTQDGLPQQNPENKSTDSKEETSNQGKFLNMLRRNGLLTAYRHGRYRFRHAHIAAWLASLTLKEIPAETLAERAHLTAWQPALGYAAAHTAIDPAVRALLSSSPDILHQAQLTVARWLSQAPNQVAWRGPTLKYLGNLLMAPDHPPTTRARAAAALLGTRDTQVIYIFRQAARNPDAYTRQLACLGMGAIGNSEAIADLIPLLEDHTEDVQLAAALGLGAIGTEPALEALTITLTEGSEKLRQAIAETIATLPDEGYPILYDAITHDDVMVRRAATFGLRRVGTRWAIDALYRAFLEDSQWYVRSAAQQAFQELKNQAGQGPITYPAMNEIPWLVNWANSNGEPIPTGQAASQILYNALSAPEAEIRDLAARNLGQLGEINAAGTLYNTLRDRQPAVRHAACEALAHLSMLLGQPLPTATT